MDENNARIIRFVTLSHLVIFKALTLFVGVRLFDAIKAADFESALPPPAPTVGMMHLLPPVLSAFFPRDYENCLITLWMCLSTTT